MASPVVRSDGRLEKGENRDPRGERFHLQGARWRFPKDLELSEVEARIGRIKELWKNLERVPESGCVGLVSTPLANEVAWFTERPWRTFSSHPQLTP